MKSLKNAVLVAVASIIGLVATEAGASTIFSENFNEYAPGGYPYPLNGPIFQVTSGSVDIIPASGAYDVDSNGGEYVDLDGTGGVPNSNGTLETVSSYTLLAGKTYTLTFDYAGDHRGYGGNGVEVFAVLPDSSEATFLSLNDLPSDFPTGGGFAVATYKYTAPTDLTVKLGFRSTGTPDQQGALLDNVQLAVPDGGVTAILLGLAMSGVALVRRKWAA